MHAKITSASISLSYSKIIPEEDISCISPRMSRIRPPHWMTMAKNLASRIGVAAPLLDNPTNPMLNMKSTSIAVIVPLEVVVTFFDRKIGVYSPASSYPDDGGENDERVDKFGINLGLGGTGGVSQSGSGIHKESSSTRRGLVPELAPVCGSDCKLCCAVLCCDYRHYSREKDGR
jgi:hypothetical protein